MGSRGHSLSESAQIWAAVRKQKLLQCRSCSSSRVKFLWATLSLSSPHTRGCVLRGQIVLHSLSDDRDIDINSRPHTSAAIFEELMVGKEVMVMVMVGKEVGT